MFKLPHNCTHLIHQQSNAQNSPSQPLNSMWTVNFQMFKLDLEKVEEPEIKLPTSRKHKRVPEKYIFLLYWLCQSLWLCGSQQTVEILKEMGIQDHLTHLLKNLYLGQEATVRTGHGRRNWFQIRKGVCQGCILSPCLFNFCAEYTLWNARWSTSLNQDCPEKHQ